MSIHFNYVIVDVDNKTLWVRSRASCTPAQAYMAVCAIQERLHAQTLYLLESDEIPSTGKERSVRFVLPLAQARSEGYTEGACRVEVWHRKVPVFDSYFAEGANATERQAEFCKVAEVLAPTANALSAAYETTQNVESSWNPVTTTRSSMPGDVLVVHQDGEQRVYRVKPVGWAELTAFA